MSELEIALMGCCAFCANHNHDFPHDPIHVLKHEDGWHGCDVYGGFRLQKPLCPDFQRFRGSVVLP